MVIKRLDPIEHVQGQGATVKKGTEEDVGTLGYDFTVYQEIIDAGSMVDRDAELPGKQRTEGFVDGFDFMLVGEYLTISLEDGRCFDFFISESATGKIAPQGGFYDPPKVD